MMLSLIAIARMVRTSHELVSQLIDALVGVGWTRRDAAKLVDSALAAAQAAPLGSRVDFERRDTSPSGADLRGLFSSVSQAIIDEKGHAGAAANMAKHLAAKASWEAANVCLQTHGGFGFACEYDVERKFRETRLYQVAPISTNLIYAYVAEHILGLPRSF